MKFGIQPTIPRCLDFVSDQSVPAISRDPFVKQTRMSHRQDNQIHNNARKEVARFAGAKERAAFLSEQKRQTVPDKAEVQISATDVLTEFATLAANKRKEKKNLEPFRLNNIWQGCGRVESSCVSTRIAFN